MVLCNSQPGPIDCAQQLVLIHQLKARVQIVPIKEVDRRLERVAVQVMHFTGIAYVVASPDEGRRPVAMIEWLVVLDRGGYSPDVGVWLAGLRLTQEAIAYLHCPTSPGRKRKAHRAGVPWMRFEVVSIFVRFAAVEDRAFELEPAIRESGGQDSKADVRRILQMMSERR